MPEFDINREPTTVAECERQMLYCKMLLKSYEAKVERIEPRSTEFNSTVASMFEVEDAINKLIIKSSMLCLQEIQQQYPYLTTKS